MDTRTQGYETRFRELLALPRGWGDSGAEEPIVPRCVARARALLAAVPEWEPSVIPTEDGGLLLENDPSAFCVAVWLGPDYTHALCSCDIACDLEGGSECDASEYVRGLVAHRVLAPRRAR